MKTITIYGSSDDLIEIEGDVEGADEYYAYGVADSPRVSVEGIFGIVSQKEKTPWMKVYAIYDGCWHFSIGPFDEGMPLPSWSIRYSMNENQYSVQMEIVVTNDVYVERLDKQPD